MHPRFRTRIKALPPQWSARQYWICAQGQSGLQKDIRPEASFSQNRRSCYTDLKVRMESRSSLLGSASQAVAFFVLQRRRARQMTNGKRFYPDQPYEECVQVRLFPYNPNTCSALCYISKSLEWFSVTLEVFYKIRQPFHDVGSYGPATSSASWASDRRS